jgi:hypothetical protein
MAGIWLAQRVLSCRLLTPLYLRVNEDKYFQHKWHEGLYMNRWLTIVSITGCNV